MDYNYFFCLFLVFILVLRWRLIDADFDSYFCIYLFPTSRGMSKPLLPKAISLPGRQPTFTRTSLFAIPAENLNTNRGTSWSQM